MAQQSSATSLSLGATMSFDDITCHKDVELRSAGGGCCSAGRSYYFLNQSFAIVRHADRLDHTAEWETFPDAETFPNDTPLTRDGFDHARKVGDVLKKTGKPWKLIVASPYFRCAQTASCIAEKLGLPVHFDLDLGEVFDDVSMIGDCRGKPQFRPPETLEGKLREDFPDVEYVRDAAGLIVVEGKLQKFPESFDGARMRYCYKVKKLVQQAAAELASIVIVTHGDAVASVVGMLKEHWIIKKVPYTCYCIAERQVRVATADGKKMMASEEPVYVNPEQWKLTLDPELVHVDCSRKDYEKMHAVHEQEIADMNAKSKTIKTTYKLTSAKQKEAAESLKDLNASGKDEKTMMKKANTTTFAQHDRVMCRPGQASSEDLAKSGAES